MTHISRGRGYGSHEYPASAVPEGPRHLSGCIQPTTVLRLRQGKHLQPIPTLGEESMNRKLIRPNLTEIKEQMSQDKERERDAARRKMHPPTDTFAESYYYLKQMNKKTPMAVVFTDGEIVEGYIEWYDRNCIKLNRDNAPNLLVYKNNIRYLYKVNEAPDTSGDEAKKKK
jgi:host factor-I protein